MTRKPQTHFTRIAPAVVGLSFALAQPVTGIAFADDPCAPYWDNTIGQPGMGAPPADPGVSAFAVFDDGSGSGPALYAGGSFTSAGGVPANRIAKWDGTSWTPLGSGMSGSLNVVMALTVFDDGLGDGPALYAAGSFTLAGGQSANRIAKWDGFSWSPLGSGIDHTVRALTVFDDGMGGPALYAGGFFTSAGGTEAKYIAKWDGNSWSPVGAGMDASVVALTVFDDSAGGGPALYAGGYFTLAGGTAANRIAKWDGISWSPLDTGVTGGPVRALLADEDPTVGPSLYAGGSFETAGGISANRVAKWDGTSWSPLGAGLVGHVNALAARPGVTGGGVQLYAGGAFIITADGTPANRIVIWNGMSWSPLSEGVDNQLNALQIFDDFLGSGDALYVGGKFSTAGGLPAKRIAVWRMPQPAAPGDLNCDGTINNVDLLTLLDSWGPCTDCGNCPADLTGDCAVGVADLLILLGNWG